MTSMGESNVQSDHVADAVRERICCRPYEVEPGKFVRCQSRRMAVCPSCARVMRGDWERIARSGLYDGDGHPVAGYRYAFITLSAPTFGKVHDIPQPWKPRDEWLRCSCGVKHTPDEVKLRGVPVNLDAYDYASQVAWHGALGQLWSSSVAAMRRQCSDVEFFAVRELQARMALHVHAVVRVPASATVDAVALGKAARAATTVHLVTGEMVGWGQRGVKDRDIQSRITEPDGMTPDTTRAAARVIGYVSKALGYSLKDVVPGASVTEDATPERLEFVRRLRLAARFWVRCPDCPESGPADCPRRAHDNLGYGGHVVTVSRTTENREGWSLSHLTRTRLRAERRAWMEANRPADLGGGLDDADVRLAEWLAEQAARRARETWEARQHARAP